MSEQDKRIEDAAKEIMRFVCNNLHYGINMFNGWDPFEQIIRKHLQPPDLGPQRSPASVAQINAQVKQATREMEQ